MKNTAIEHPLSFLTLEQYHLDELSPGDRQRVDGHLNTCNVCRTDLTLIEADDVVLPPLALSAPDRGRPGFWAGRFGWPVWAAAMATVLFVGLGIWVALPLFNRQSPLPPSARMVKGGEISLGLVRMRDGSVASDVDRYTDGDMFQLEVTCPFSDPVSWRAVVFQNGTAYYPMGRSGRLTCGNRVLLTGGFSPTGPGDLVVCVVLGPEVAQLEHESKGTLSIDRLPDRSLCTTVTWVAPH